MSNKATIPWICSVTSVLFVHKRNQWGISLARGVLHQIFSKDLVKMRGQKDLSQ